MDARATKLEKLKNILRGYGAVAVAFSGGVDSTFLLAVAHEALGQGAVAVTVGAAFVPEWEANEAKAFCRQHGIRHVVREINVLADEQIAANPQNRCYLCKLQVFNAIIQAASELGIAVVADGTNVSDLGDYRPGMQALQELGVCNPLLEAGFTKDEIRACSRQMGLSTADRQSFACLATRFPYGERITEEALERVEAAERYLSELGFEPLRVRSHAGIARIEVAPSQIAHFMEADIRDAALCRLKELGFSYVTLDLQGFRSGSMNETLENES